MVANSVSLQTSTRIYQARFDSSAWSGELLSFAINGDVLEPPAPRALDLFEVRIVNGVVSVDTGKQRKRSAFDPEQATYPEQA